MTPRRGAERDRVGADMTLHVHDVEAGQIAEVRRVATDDTTQSLRSAASSARPYPIATDMNGNARLPVPEVRATKFVHGEA